MNRTVRVGIVSIALATFGVFAAAWVGVWILRGSFFTAVVISGLVVWAFGFAFYLVYLNLRKVKPQREFGMDGVLLRPPKVVNTAFTIAISAVFFAAVIYTIFAPFGLIDYAPSGVLRVTVPAVCLLFVVFGFPILCRVLKHGGGHHLRLHQGGFEVWNGQWGSLVRGKWGDIEQILDHPLRGAKPFHEVMVLALANGRSAMLVADAITGDPGALT